MVSRATETMAEAIHVAREEVPKELTRIYPRGDGRAKAYLEIEVAERVIRELERRGFKVVPSDA